MNKLIILQLVLKILAFILAGIVIIWAIYTGQFQKMDKASGLPLEIEEDEDNIT